MEECGIATLGQQALGSIHAQPDQAGQLTPALSFQPGMLPCMLLQPRRMQQQHACLGTNGFTWPPRAVDGLLARGHYFRVLGFEFACSSRALLLLLLMYPAISEY